MSRRWCNVCHGPQEFGAGWFEVTIGGKGACTIQPVTDPDRYDAAHMRNSTLACGQGHALVLVERFLHTRTFSVPLAPAAVNQHSVCVSSR